MSNVSHSQNDHTLYRQHRGVYTESDSNSSEEEATYRGFGAALDSSSDDNLPSGQAAHHHVYTPPSGEQNRQEPGSPSGRPTSPPPGSAVSQPTSDSGQQLAAEVTESSLSSETEPFFTSGSEFIPSDQPGGPARLRKPPKEKFAKKVDASNINRNETSEARRKAIQDDQVHYERRKTSPDEWIEVIEETKSAGHSQHLNPKIMCNYILEKWWDVRFAPGKRPIYLSFPEMELLTQSLIHGEYVPSTTFNKSDFSGLYSSTAPNAKHRIVPAHNEPLLHCGFRLSSSQGFIVWDNLYNRSRAHEMGWGGGEVGPERVKVVTKNWKQVSFTGCMHDQRMSLLTWTVEWSLSAIALHIKLYSSHETILSVLAQRGLPQSLRDQAESTALPDANRRLAEECHLKEDSGLVINRPNQRMGGSGEGEEEFQERELEDPIEGEEEEGMSYQRELLQLARRTGGKLPVQPYSFREERPVAVVKEFNPEFDSYKTGPTVEMLVEAHRELCLAFHFDPPIARWSTIGDRFRDHGYRRTEGGFHQFFLNNPSPDEQLEHFFPLPPKGVLDEWRKRKEAANVEAQEVAEGDWVGHRLPEAAITGNDLEGLDSQEDGGTSGRGGGPEKGMMTYITGKTSSGKHIRLDIKQVQEGSINLHIMPFKGERAPIKTHNHAYDKCRIWKRTKKRCLPGGSIIQPPQHTLAHFGRNAGSAEVYVVFPRMKHKYPLRKGSETKVPSEVETFWLENVVYKAVKGLKQMGIKPYTDWVLEDTVFKHGGLQDHAIPCVPEHLDKILEGIRGILKENEEDESYSRFGSLFFVLQKIMGIKVSTSLDEDWGGLWKKL
ncbi:hypothetical protein BJ322DRAFT_1167208, partial [Thelephora terrestris]